MDGQFEEPLGVEIVVAQGVESGDVVGVGRENKGAATAVVAKASFACKGAGVAQHLEFGGAAGFDSGAGKAAEVVEIVAGGGTIAIIPSPGSVDGKLHSLWDKLKRPLTGDGAGWRAGLSH